MAAIIKVLLHNHGLRSIEHQQFDKNDRMPLGFLQKSKQVRHGPK
jgi:hypothetical protein